MRGAEIGVWRAHFSRALLHKIDNLELIMIDPYLPWGGLKHSEAGIEYAMDIAKRMTDFAADRRRFLIMTSEQAAQYVSDGSLDFVFIDGDHRYEYVLQDIRLWMPKIRAGGFICGHDYHNDPNWCPGVRQAVDECFEHVGRLLGMVWYAEV